MNLDEYRKLLLDPLAMMLEGPKIWAKFIEDNVIIPKGENRHKYADVLHEWIEGAEVQYNNGFSEWTTIPNTVIAHQANEYRIKPSEPVYEWQWYYVGSSDGLKYYISERFTESEARSKLRGTPTEKWLKDESTKRERKQ